MNFQKEIIIRKGTNNDIKSMYQLVEELAIHHKHNPDYISNSPEQMLADGFGEKPFFRFFVAEDNGEIVGTAIYYFTYSTWKGKSLYLEDLIITKSHRGKGIGKMFMEALSDEVIKCGAQKMKWQVAEDNHSAIGFYENIDAELDPDWINCELSRKQIVNSMKEKELVTT
ncbi:GNAT family N-acetyltransferase [Chondrinema litorale]|uniref:GNAT family N-acetyltransferase n=1 Tax=Chondrinema litorale TaxID=2994555 RepID=UPI002542D61C|nr:GNAT family N-acetyltransferase [Chondrinema litorale]UZR94284.1 GNAT family N-acetyltransferase [Chondrinema litorale]